MGGSGGPSTALPPPRPPQAPPRPQSCRKGQRAVAGPGPACKQPSARVRQNRQLRRQARRNQWSLNGTTAAALQQLKGAPVAKDLPWAAARRRRAQPLGGHPRLHHSSHAAHGQVASRPQQRLRAVGAAQCGGAGGRQRHAGIVAAEQKVLGLVLCTQLHGCEAACIRFRNPRVRGQRKAGVQPRAGEADQQASAATCAGTGSKAHLVRG